MNFQGFASKVNEVRAQAAKAVAKLPTFDDMAATDDYIHSEEFNVRGEPKSWNQQNASKGNNTAKDMQSHSHDLGDSKNNGSGNFVAATFRMMEGKRDNENKTKAFGSRTIADNTGPRIEPDETSSSGSWSLLDRPLSKRSGGETPPTLPLSSAEEEPTPVITAAAAATSVSPTTMKAQPKSDFQKTIEDGQQRQQNERQQPQQKSIETPKKNGISASKNSSNQKRTPTSMPLLSVVASTLTDTDDTQQTDLTGASDGDDNHDNRNKNIESDKNNDKLFKKQDTVTSFGSNINPFSAIGNYSDSSAASSHDDDGESDDSDEEIEEDDPIMSIMQKSSESSMIIKNKKKPKKNNKKIKQQRRMNKQSTTTSSLSTRDSSDSLLSSFSQGAGKQKRRQNNQTRKKKNKDSRSDTPLGNDSEKQTNVNDSKGPFFGFMQPQQQQNQQQQHQRGPGWAIRNFATQHFNNFLKRPFQPSSSSRSTLKTPPPLARERQTRDNKNYEEIFLVTSSNEMLGDEELAQLAKFKTTPTSTPSSSPSNILSYSYLYRLVKERRDYCFIIFTLFLAVFVYFFLG